jgi:predicted ATPase
VNELFDLAEKKGALFWKPLATLQQGFLLAMTHRAAEAVHQLASGLEAWRRTAAKLHWPFYLVVLAKAHGDLGQFGDARSRIDEAIAAVDTTKERLWEAEVDRVAGELALKDPQPDAAKAQAYFQRALAVSRQQQAKSWELRAAMSLARLWRDQGKVSEAHELLAPVYGWFTEGFETRDLKEARALLEELAA